MEQPFSEEVAKRSIKMQEEITKLLSKQRGYFEKMIKESTSLPDLLVDKYENTEATARNA